MNENEPALILIDWNQISTVDEFYDSILSQSGAPSWHGRNLNALNDSWVTGDVNQYGPPYHYRIHKRVTRSEEMNDFEKTVEKYARQSVEENGGKLEID